MLDPELCERARQARDPRFDGRFFIGVVTTGIYCRPVCPVRPPKAENVRFYPSAAAASQAGFRPCLRCRPEAAPGTPAWQGTSATVSRGLRLIEAGALDEGSVEELAGRLGIGARQLGRLFDRHLGASPLAVAQTRRLHFAKQLIDETNLSMAQVAMTAGYGSVRRFNAAVRGCYDRTPGELRRASNGERRAQVRDTRPSTDAMRWSLRLSFRRPFAWEALLGYLEMRATPGVESVDGGAYRRTFSIDGSDGSLEVRMNDAGDALVLAVRFPDATALLKVAARVRRIFDLDADPGEIAAHLGRDAVLAPKLRALPGLRVPGAWDGFELTVRAILGQQVSVRGATTLAGRLATRFGRPLDDGSEGLLVFPTAEALAEAPIEEIGLPGARAEAIRGVARATREGELCFEPGVDPVELTRRLTAVRGIGEWTACYVAMRALGEPDAFPAGDLVLRKAFAKDDAPCTPKQLREIAEPWRPWRAYAALHVWSGGTC